MSPIEEMIKFVAEAELTDEQLVSLIKRTVQDQVEYDLEVKLRRPTQDDLNRRYTL